LGRRARMLTVTPAAAAAISSLLESPEVPDGACVRLAQGLAPSGEATIGLTVVTDPEEDDAVVPAGEDVDVFVDADAAPVLDDKELDVEMEGERAFFSLHRQSFDGGPPDA
jgi:Fe-S cluster assembly iron-binding protein IscA